MQARITIAGNSRAGLLLQLYLPKEWCAEFHVMTSPKILGEALSATWGHEWGDERTRGKHFKSKADVETELHFLRIALRDASAWVANESVEYEIYVNLASAPTASWEKGGNNESKG